MGYPSLIAPTFPELAVAIANAGRMTVSLLLRRYGAEVPDLAPWLTSREQWFVGVRDALAAIAQDPALTPEGKVQRVRAAFVDAKRALAEDDQLVEREEQRLDAMRGDALASQTKPPQGSDRVETLLRQQEVRAHFATLDPRERMLRYLEACSGADLELVAAVDSAPASLRLIDDATRQKGVTARLASVEAGEGLEAAATATETRRLAVQSIRLELVALAERFGIRWADL